MTTPPPTDATVNRELLTAIIEDVDADMASDRGGCPYLDRWEGKPGSEDATCGYGCREEPECVTCEPEGGWPSRQEGFDYRAAWVTSLAECLEANLGELVEGV